MSKLLSLKLAPKTNPLSKVLSRVTSQSNVYGLRIELSTTSATQFDLKFVFFKKILNLFSDWFLSLANNQLLVHSKFIWA